MNEKGQIRDVYDAVADSTRRKLIRLLAVTDRKVGRETRYRLNPAPLREIQDWVSFYGKFWKENIVLLNQLLLEE